MGGVSRDFGVLHWGRRGGSFDDASRNLLSPFQSSFGDPTGDFGVNGFPMASIAVVPPAAVWTGANNTTDPCIAIGVSWRFVYESA